jgi:hypothetical protein
MTTTPGPGQSASHQSPLLETSAGSLYAALIGSQMEEERSTSTNFEQRATTYAGRNHATQIKRNQGSACHSGTGLLEVCR